MRAIVQRVSSASVRVDGRIVGQIERGLLVYLGVGSGDQPDDLEYLAGKIRHLRIFADSEGKMNLDIGQVGGRILVISNFTLYADTRQGRRPAFTPAAPPDVAEALYDQFCARLAELGLEPERGRFGAMMAVSSINDGPVNLILDSRDRSAQ